MKNDHGAKLAAVGNDTTVVPTSGRQATKVIGKCPRDGRDWDNQCARCGSSVMFNECDNCGGEGWIEDDDWQADVGDGFSCDWCRGSGGHWACISSTEWCLANPISGRAEVERGSIEWFTFDTLPETATEATNGTSGSVPSAAPK